MNLIFGIIFYQLINLLSHFHCVFHCSPVRMVFTNDRWCKLNRIIQGEANIKCPKKHVNEVLIMWRQMIKNGPTWILHEANALLVRVVKIDLREGWWDGSKSHRRRQWNVPAYASDFEMESFLPRIQFFFELWAISTFSSYFRKKHVVNISRR